jgi:hypothetical protein
MGSGFARLALGLGLVAVLTLPPTAAQAAGARPVAAHCGDVLTSDAYLAEDLTCDGPGLTLAAGLTLDLRGHRLNGRAGIVAMNVVGLHSSPVIRNGLVSGWGAGVISERCTDGGAYVPRTVRVSRVMFIDNGTAISAFNGSETRSTYCRTTFNVRHSRFNRNRFAIYADYGGSVEVSFSRFTSNINAVDLFGHLRVQHSQFLDNERAIDCTACAVTSVS